MITPGAQTTPIASLVFWQMSQGPEAVAISCASASCYRAPKISAAATCRDMSRLCIDGIEGRETTYTIENATRNGDKK